MPDKEAKLGGYNQMNESAIPAEVEEKRLKSEYKELCNDWWQRDRNVLDKLRGAGILFGLLGLAIGNIPPERILIQIFLLIAGAIFSMILCISMSKDILYRDGTEALLIRLAARLGITESLKGLKSFKDGKHPNGFDDGLKFEELKFSRKVKILPEKSSLPKWLSSWIEKRQTFRWLLFFYMISFGIFVLLLILISVNRLLPCSNLPI